MHSLMLCELTMKLNPIFSDYKLQIPPKESAITREDICVAILSSSYFSDMNVEFYEDPYVNTARKSSKFDPNKRTKPYHYKINKVRTLKGSSVNELMFLCAAWNRTSHIIEIFYVSREYHPQNNTDPSIHRFVFTHNEKNEIVVIALAERAAELSKSVVDEHWSSRLEDAGKSFLW